MADIALQVRDDVIGTHALGLHIVVAARAAPLHFPVIEIDRRTPGHGRMAASTKVRRENMARRFGRRAHLRAHTMAGRAIVRRAFEDGIDVAGFTGQVAVLSEEFKTCGQVVETRALPRLRTASDQ